jgi:hypothetical protein
LGVGESVITVSHPKAQFNVNILVYAAGNDVSPVYITTDSNVIQINNTSGSIQYSVLLRGGDSSDYHAFVHEVTEGKNIIDVNFNNNIGTIYPKEKGIARITLTHPKADYPMEIVVIVYEEVEYKYIDIDQTLIILEEGKNTVIKTQVIGDVPGDYRNHYSIEIEDNSIIQVFQSQGNFSVMALKRGKSVINIKNHYADFSREVLVIVNSAGEMYDNEIYITTNQNVIIMEEGGPDSVLSMTLAGGNEADRNNFIWTVDDGTVIGLESAMGIVNYRTRSIVSNIGNKFEAQALIKAKKTGTATITLENPKAKNSFTVIVKVYKKGTFGILPVVLEGQPLLRVDVGERIDVDLRVISGKESDLANVQWISENSAIMETDGINLKGTINGKSTGLTTLRVKGENAKNEWTALGVVGDENYQKAAPFMYVPNPFITVLRDNVFSFSVVCENMT